MGMASPRTGAPSMISYLPRVSTSVRLAEPLPVTSRRRISTSMYFSFMRTCRSGIVQVQFTKILRFQIHSEYMYDGGDEGWGEEPEHHRACKQWSVRLQGDDSWAAHVARSASAVRRV